jgi:hypothetical protein
MLMPPVGEVGGALGPGFRGALGPGFRGALGPGFWGASPSLAPATFVSSAWSSTTTTKHSRAGS